LGAQALLSSTVTVAAATRNQSAQAVTTAPSPSSTAPMAIAPTAAWVTPSATATRRGVTSRVASRWVK
jgi:hypothetical protein